MNIELQILCNDCCRLTNNSDIRTLYIDTIEQVWFLCLKCYDYDINNSLLSWVKRTELGDIYTMSQYMMYDYSKKIKKQLRMLETIYFNLKKNYVAGNLDIETASDGVLR